MFVLFQLLVYPGLLWVGIVSLVLETALGRSTHREGTLSKTWQALRGHGSLAHAVSIVLGLVALGLLPWPATPAGPLPNFDRWRLWAFTEACFLAALLPGLTSSSPLMNRAAVREAQIGVSGRTVLWIALYSGLGATNTTVLGLIPTLVGTFVALCALPAAAGWQPFGGESGLGLGDVDAYLHPGDRVVAGWARDLRSILLIALVATVFVSAPQLVWWQQLGIKLWLALAVALVGRSLRGASIHRPIGDALQFCWRWILPSALLAVVSRIWIGN